VNGPSETEWMAIKLEREMVLARAERLSRLGWGVGTGRTSRQWLRGLFGVRRGGAEPKVRTTYQRDEREEPVRQRATGSV